MLVLLFCFSFYTNGQNQLDVQLANEYLLKGEKKKALELFQELVKRPENISIVHNNYLNLLIDQAEFSIAQEYLKRNLKREPDNLQYRLDVGFVNSRQGDIQKADKVFREVITAQKANQSRIKSISDYFTARSLFDYSILSLLECRKNEGNEHIFSLELANLYRIKGEGEKMTEEYLNYATQNVANTQYIKNVLQVLLTKPEELEDLEKLLYKKVQTDPDDEVYIDLLIWVGLQQKNFYAAFIQARAYDKRYKTQGDRCMEIANVALENKDFSNAATIYKYVTINFAAGENVNQARLGLVKARDARLRGTYPIIADSVNSLVKAYKSFIKQNEQLPNALEATRNLALIQADYQHQVDSAAQELIGLINNPRASIYLQAKAKLDLADIYITKQEPWESALLYSQVEKTQKENAIGYEAKLRNAKLSYYRGDFQLAQEHLDILKQATTREIANDAMDLRMRIKENIAMDSAGIALKEFAAVELLIKQNKTDQALQRLQNIQQGKLTNNFFEDTVVAFSNFAIIDDCLWLEANIRLQKGEHELAITLLQRIVAEYPTDILADDAFFTIGEIYERGIGDKAKAMLQYQNLLVHFPGSVYVAEARKRFRFLRGDFSLPTEPRM